MGTFLPLKNSIILLAFFFYFSTCFHVSTNNLIIWPQYHLEKKCVNHDANPSTYLSLLLFYISLFNIIIFISRGMGVVSSFRRRVVVVVVVVFNS